MDNENDQKVASDAASDEVEEIVETKDESGTDTTDWKAEALKAQGIAKRLKTKADKQKLESKVDAKVEKKLEAVKKSDELDYAQLAFHNSKSASLKIETEEEMEFLKTQLEETGKPLQSLLNSKFFQTEFSAFKNSKTVDSAVPNHSGRNSQGAVSKSVEFWLSKGVDEFPPDTYENKQLILDIVNARYKKAKEGK